jgi:primosomal protein N'
MRVCHVLPDIAAVERSFDYAVPDALGASVRVGTVVRVPLHGRREIGRAHV